MKFLAIAAIFGFVLSETEAAGANLRQLAAYNCL